MSNWLVEKGVLAYLSRTFLQISKVSLTLEIEIEGSFTISNLV